MIWFTVRDTTMENAWLHIELQLLPVVIATLTTSSDPPPRIELVHIAEIQKDGTLGSAIFPWMWATFATFLPTQLSADDFDQMSNRYALTEQLVTGPSRRYQESLQLRDASDSSPRSLASVILSFFLVIEAISRKETHVPAFEGEAAIAAGVIIDNLQVELAREESIEFRLKKIRTAVTGMEALRETSFKPKLLRLASKIGLEPHTVSEALAIAQLRNSSLAHSGSDSPGDLESWVTRAEAAARVILTHYIDFVVATNGT